MRYIALAIVVILALAALGRNLQQEPEMDPPIHCTLELQAQGICG